MDIIRSHDVKGEAGRALTKLLEEERTCPILLMLSGGSALSLLECVDEAVLGPHITLTVLDERYTKDPAVHNFTQLTRTQFFERCSARGVRSISTEILEGETGDEVAQKWENALRAWKAEYPDGVIIVTMGVGADGHTAGIFTGEYAVDFSGDAWVVSYHVPKEVHQYQDRITVTDIFLKTYVDKVIVYAEGDEKQNIISMLDTETCKRAQYPACILKEMHEVYVFSSLL